MDDDDDCHDGWEHWAEPSRTRTAHPPDWPWPVTGRLLETGPLPERFPGQYSAEVKAAWQPWIEAARAGASLDDLQKLEPGRVAAVRER